MADQVHRLLLASFTKIGAAAMMGNIDVETGGSFDYTTKQRGGNGYGLFQFDFMKQYYNKWRDEQKLQDSAETQIKFVKATLTDRKDIVGAGNVKKINDALNGNDLDNATTVFCNLWEKPGVPHLDRRIAAAKKYYK